MSDFKDSFSELLKVFLEDSFELWSLSEGFIGRRNLPYPRSHLFTQTDWTQSFLNFLQLMSTKGPCQLQNSLWDSLNFSLCPFLFLSLPFHRCWSQKNPLRNTLHSDLRLRACFPGEPTTTTHKAQFLFSGAHCHMLGGIFILKGCNYGTLLPLSPIYHQHAWPGVPKHWLSR